MAGNQEIKQLNIVTRYVQEVDKKSTQKAKGEIQGLTKLISGTFKLIAGAAATKFIVDLGLSAVNAAAKFETLSTSFKVLTGSIKEANRLIDALNKKSLKTPFTPEQLQQSAKTLLSFGRTVDQTLEDINILGEVAAATGSDLQNLAVVFGQVAGAGKLAGQDALQFVNAGIPVYQLLAESTGKNIAELKKLQEQGKITFNDLRRAFAEASLEGGKFAGALELQSKTLEGLRSTNTGVWEEVSRAIGQRLLPAAKEVVTVFIRLGNSVLNLVKPNQDLVKTLKGTQTEFNSQVEVLKRLNPESEAARRIRDEINTVYKDYLPNLLTEKNSLEDIEKAQKAANKAFLGKIILAELEGELAPLRKELQAVGESIVQAELAAGRFASGELTQIEKALTEAPTAKLREDFQAYKDLIQSGAATENLENDLERVQGIIDAVNAKYEVLAKNLLNKTLGELYNSEVTTTPKEGAGPGTATDTAKKIKKNIEDFLVTDPIELFKGGGGDFLEQINAQRDRELKASADAETELYNLRLNYKQELAKIDVNDAERREALSKAFEIEEIKVLLRIARAKKELSLSEADTTGIRQYSLEIADLIIRLQELEGLTGGPDDFTTSIIKKIFGDKADVEGIRQAYGQLFNEIGRLWQNVSRDREQALNDEVQASQNRVNQLISQREAGSAELLAIEQDRLDKSLEKQRAFARDQRQLAQAVAAAELIAAIAKIASQSGITAPVAIPLVLSAIAGFIASVPGLLTLAEGTTYVNGPGTHKSDSVPAMLSKGEGVLSWEDNKRRLHIKSNKELVDLALLGEKVSKGQFTPEVTRVLETSGQFSKIDTLIKEVRLLRGALNIKQTATSEIEGRKLKQLVDLEILDDQHRAALFR